VHLVGFIYEIIWGCTVKKHKISDLFSFPRDPRVGTTDRFPPRDPRERVDPRTGKNLSQQVL